MAKDTAWSDIIWSEKSYL